MDDRDDFFSKIFRNLSGKDENNTNDFIDGFQHFNQIFNQMDQMMRNIHTFSNQIESLPVLTYDQNDKELNVKKNKNLRDSFLKSDSIPSEDSKKSFFENSLIEDDNSKVSSHKDDIKPLNFSSTAQSTTYRRIQRPDGSIEEIKTFKNSDGKEEKTVTRIIGDKMHSVVEKKTNKNIIEETEEIFQNFDEKNLDDFNKMWNNSSSFTNNNNKNDKISIPDDNTQNSSFISKFFSWFK